MCVMNTALSKPADSDFPRHEKRVQKPLRSIAHWISFLINFVLFFHTCKAYQKNSNVIRKHVMQLKYNFNCCFTVHFDKYKTILPTNAPFIKT